MTPARFLMVTIILVYIYMYVYNIYIHNIYLYILHIYIHIYRQHIMLSVCLSYVKLTAWAELGVAHAHAQSLFLAVKPVTPVLFISYSLEL